MTAAPPTCVADASVAIQMFVVEPLSAEATQLFAHLAADPPARFWVPDLFYIECASILWKYVRRHGYSPDSARQDIADLRALPFSSVPTADLAQEALDLAIALEITPYDASYVTLSQRQGIPLVTADEALVNKLRGSGYDVQWLKGFPIPAPP